MPEKYCVPIIVCHIGTTPPLFYVGRYIFVYERKTILKYVRTRTRMYGSLSTQMIHSTFEIKFRLSDENHTSVFIEYNFVERVRTYFGGSF